MAGKSNVKRCAKWMLTLLLAMSLTAGTYIWYVWAHHNFHVVIDERVYRSGQMDAETLTRVIEERGIRSIVNLRGANPKHDWYRTETNAAGLLRIEHFDFALSARREVQDDELDKILETIRNAPKPVLIHCDGGADRSALVAALYLVELEGRRPDVAHRQLSVRYGHVPLVRPKVSAMDNSFWRYVSNHALRVESLHQTNAPPP